MPQHHVIFHRNYGADDSYMIADRMVHYCEELGDAPADPSREGYTFVGWAISPDAQQMAEWDSEATMPDHDLDFYATWKLNDGAASPDEGETVLPGDQGEGEEDVADGDEGTSVVSASNEAGEESNGANAVAPVLAPTGDGVGIVARLFLAIVLASGVVAGVAFARSRR